MFTTRTISSGASTRIRHAQVRNAELRGDLGAVAVVAVEQLDNAGGLAELARPARARPARAPRRRARRAPPRRARETSAPRARPAIQPKPYVALVAEAKRQARPTTSFTVMFAAAATPARGLCASTRPGIAVGQARHARVEVQLPQALPGLRELQADDLRDDAVGRAGDDEHHAVVRREPALLRVLRHDDAEPLSRPSPACRRTTA